MHFSHPGEGDRNSRTDIEASSTQHRLTRQRVELGHFGDDLVIGVAELVAARAVILVSELVGGDLDRRAGDHGDELAVVDVVG